MNGQYYEGRKLVKSDSTDIHISYKITEILLVSFVVRFFLTLYTLQYFFK